MLRIILDVDGVCADTVGSLLDAVSWENDEFDLKPHDVTCFDMGTCFGPEFRKHMLNVFKRPDFWAGLPQYRSAALLVPEMVARHHVVFATAPWISCPDWEGIRRRWLSAAYGVRSGAMISCSQKHLISGDVFIDDKTSTVVAWHRANPDGKAIVMARPWNADDIRPDGVSRWSWLDIGPWINAHGKR